MVLSLPSTCSPKRSSVTQRFTAICVTPCILALTCIIALTSTSPAGAAAASKGKSSQSKGAQKKKNTTTSSASAAEASSAASDSADRDGPGDTIVFVDAGIRSDLGTFVIKETVGRATITDESQDSQAFGPLMHAGFLTRIAKQIRLGGAFGYGFKYTIVEDLTAEQKDNEQEPNRTEIGQLLTLDARLEWDQQLSGPLWLTVTPIVGITAVLAGGELEEATNQLEGSHNTSKGPRLGFIAGGELGVRYQYNSWFSFKVAGGWGYTFQSLLSASMNADVGDSKRTWRLQASRLSAALALESSF